MTTPGQQSDRSARDDPTRGDSTGRRQFLAVAGASVIAGCSQFAGSDEEPLAGSAVRTETPTHSATSTPALGVHYSTGLLATASSASKRYVSTALPPAFSRPVEIECGTTFEVRNDDTGGTVTVSVTPDGPALAREVALNVYDHRGRIRSDGHVDVNHPERENPISLDVEVSGDAGTFSERTFAGYEVSMSRDGSVVDSTGVHRFPTGHPKEFASAVDGGTLHWSFNAGKLPGDGNRRGWISTDGGTVDAAEVSYDEAANRFVASVAADRVPAGTHRAIITVRDPESSVYLVRLGRTVTV